MSFDFWSVVNNTEFQNSAAAESESRGGGFKNFEEPGEYDITIKYAEMRQTRSGYPMLSLRVQADSGESGFWSLLVGHGGGTSTAAKIAQQALALVLRYSGAKASGPDAMAGLRVRVWVKMNEGTDGVNRPDFRPIGVAKGAAKSAPVVAKPVQPSPAVPAPQAQEDDEYNIDDDIPF